jgi:hypothetical protein
VERASAKSFAPSACATSTPTAVPVASGSMYMTAATLAAI